MNSHRTGISVNRFFVSILLSIFLASIALAQNSISGIVFDPQNQPVTDIEVELLDSFERLIGARKTNGSGFYTFQRLRAGIYYLQVRPGSTNFTESKTRIDLGDLNAIGGVDQKQVDLRLEIKSRGTGKNVNAVVFVQNIPEDALEHFENGVRHLKKNRIEEGETELREAVRIFPEYFLALEQLGDIGLETKRFDMAEVAYFRAVSVNPRCFGCYFNLGIAQNNLGKKAEAAANLEKANEIDPGSINSHLLLGIVLRGLGRFDVAETALLKAKELGSNKEPDVNWQLAELYYFNLNKPEMAIPELESYLKNLSAEEKRKNSRKVDTIKQLIKKIRSESESDS